MKLALCYDPDNNNVITNYDVVFDSFSDMDINEALLNLPPMHVDIPPIDLHMYHIVRVENPATIKIEGNISNTVAVGDVVYIHGSTYNDDRYVVVAIGFDGVETAVVVNKTIPSGIPDGWFVKVTVVNPSWTGLIIPQAVFYDNYHRYRYNTTAQNIELLPDEILFGRKLSADIEYQRALITFRQEDLNASGMFLAEHATGSQFNLVAVYDNGDNLRLVEIQAIDADHVLIDVSAFTPILDEWKVAVVRGGGGNASTTMQIRNSDIGAGGVCDIAHNLGNRYNIVATYDESNQYTLASAVALSSNIIRYELESAYPLIGNWNGTIVRPPTYPSNGIGGVSIGITEADLTTERQFVWEHNLGNRYNVIGIYDNFGEPVFTDVAINDATTVTVDFSEFDTLAGVWRLIMIG